MIVPRRWSACSTPAARRGLVVLPVATLAGIVPGLALPCAGVLVVCASRPSRMRPLGRQRVAALGAGTPDLLRLTKDVPADLADHAAITARRARIAAARRT